MNLQLDTENVNLFRLTPELTGEHESEAECESGSANSYAARQGGISSPVAARSLPIFLIQQRPGESPDGAHQPPYQDRPVER